MNALLLAAGYATRLYPLTKDTPKPLLPVAGKPIAGYLVAQLEPVEAIKRLLVVTNHRFAGHFARWAAQSRSRFRIEVVDDGTDTNETRLGAIGDMAYVLERFPELAGEPLFVLGGDNLPEFDLADMVADFGVRNRADGPDGPVDRASPAGAGGAATVICLVRENDLDQLRRSGVVTLDASGRVTGFVEKPAEPPSDLTCPPFYLFPPEALSLIPQYLKTGRSPDAPGHFIAWLHRQAPVYGHVFDQGRLDIGTPASYAEACRRYEARASASPTAG
jgi:glucose-1-phosphate thymidylyltransferase